MKREKKKEKEEKEGEEDAILKIISQDSTDW